MNEQNEHVDFMFALKIFAIDLRMPLNCPYHTIPIIFSSKNYSTHRSMVPLIIRCIHSAMIRYRESTHIPRARTILNKRRRSVINKIRYDNEID